MGFKVNMKVSSFTQFTLPIISKNHTTPLKPVPYDSFERSNDYAAPKTSFKGEEPEMSSRDYLIEKWRNSFRSRGLKSSDFSDTDNVYRAAKNAVVDGVFSENVFRNFQKLYPYTNLENRCYITDIIAKYKLPEKDLETTCDKLADFLKTLPDNERARASLYVETLLNREGKFDKDRINKVNRLKEVALKQKSLLKSNEDLSDAFIEEYFKLNMPLIAKTVDWIGENGFIALFGMNINKLENIIFDINSTKLPKEFFQMLIQRTNLEESDVYKELKTDIDRVRNEIKNMKSSNFLKLEHEMNEKISSNEAELALLKKQNADSDETKKQKKKLIEENKNLKRKYFLSKSPELIAKEKELAVLNTKMNKLLSKKIVDINDKLRAIYTTNSAASSYPLIKIGKLSEEDREELTKVIELLNPKTNEDKEALNEILDKKLFSYLGLEYDKKTADMLNLRESKYLSDVLKSGIDFKSSFSELLELIKRDSSKSLKEIFDDLPQNRATKELFERNGLDYEKWTSYTAVPPVSSAVEADIEIAKQSALKNLENDFNDPALKKVPNQELDNITVSVRTVDMNDIKHSLFLGNQAGCCTAVGNAINEHSAPKYISNKFISTIEVVDDGEAVGNTMCYFAKVDGETALILDNIELGLKYQYSDKVRDMIFDYAKKLAAEIGGTDISVYVGPYRHKVNMPSSLKLRELSFIGNSGCDEIYIDSFIENMKINSHETRTVNLFRIN